VLLTHEPNTEEAALVRFAQAGDRAAFGALYGKFARTIHGILLAHVSCADAEDLMQNVFVRAMEQLRRPPLCSAEMSVSRSKQARRIR